MNGGVHDEEGDMLFTSFAAEIHSGQQPWFFISQDHMFTEANHPDEGAVPFFSS